MIVTVPVLCVCLAAIVSSRFALSVKSPPSAEGTASAETVTVTDSLDAGFRRAVTVVTPPFSPMRAGVNTSDTTGVPSSSMIFSIRGRGGSTPLPSVTVPVTSTVLFGPSRMSSPAVIDTVPSLAVSPTANVSWRFSLRTKSFSTPETARGRVAGAAPPGPACEDRENRTEEGDIEDAPMFTVTGSLDGPVNVALTSLFPPSSMVLGLKSRTTLGVSSSSVIVSVCGSGCATSRPLVTTPATWSVLSGASMSLFTAAMVNVSVLLVSPAAIVSVAPVSSKSAATAGELGVADTATVTTSFDGAVNIAVTVLLPPFSPIDAGSSFNINVGVPSSSVIVSVCVVGAATLLPPVADAVTSTVLSGASTSLSSAEMVTVSVLTNCPARIVSSRFTLSRKSFATAGPTAAADTVTTTSALDSPSSDAVTIVSPRFSEIDAGASAKVNVGVSSSSMIVSVRGAGAAAPLPPVAVPFTSTVLSGASTVLSLAVILTSPVLTVSPAAIVSAVPVSSKSPAATGASAITDTVTATASLDVPLSVAVTVVSSLFSEIDAWDSFSVTVGAPSSSMIVRTCAAGSATPLAPETAAATPTVLFGLSMVLFSAAIVTVPVLSVCPAGIVSSTFALSAKSPATAGRTGLADTVSVTVSLDSPLSDAVTVVEPPFSEIDVGSSFSVTSGVSSSSSIVSVCAAGSATPRPPAATPAISTVLSGASTSLLSAAIVTVPVLFVSPASILSVVPVRSKSAATAGELGVAVTVTVTASLDGAVSIAVTVLRPPFSPMDAGSSFSISVGVPSSSVIVSVCAPGAATPLPPVADAVTPTVLSGASTSLSRAVMVTVLVLANCPARIVSSRFALSRKSFATAGSTAVADTVTTTSALDNASSDAVTVVSPPSSRIDVGASSSVSVGVASSSVIVRVRGAGAAAPLPPVTVPDTVSLLSEASSSLSFAVTFTSPVLVVSPAAMVRVSPVSVKSPATAGDTGAADTVTVTASLDCPLRVAVTVVSPPFSEISAGPSARVTVGVVSSSVISRVIGAGAASPSGPSVSVPVTVTVRSGAWLSSFTAVIVTVSVLDVCPAGIVNAVFALSSTPPAPAGETAPVETVSVTGSAAAALRVAVTVVAPPSEIVVGSRASVSVGVASSSAMVRVCDAGAAASVDPDRVPVTVTVFAGLYRLSSLAVMVTVPVLDVSPASIVSVVPLNVKSLATAGETGAAATVTVTSSLTVPFRVAVTVLSPAFSEIEGGDSTSVTPVVSSSSMYKFRALASVTPGRPVTEPRTQSGFRSGPSTGLSTAVTVTVPVLHLEPASIVSVRFSLSLKSSADDKSPVSTRTVTVTL